MTAPAQYDPSAPLCRGDMDDLLRQLRSNVFPWWYPAKAKGLAVGSFIYTADFLPLAASAVATSTVNVDGDSAFLVMSLVAEERSTDDLTVFPSPAVTFNLKNAGSGAYFSSGVVAAANLFGTAQRPNLLPVPIILSPNSAFVVEAHNLEANPRNVRVALQGIKVYSYVPTLVNGVPQLST